MPTNINVKKYEFNSLSADSIKKNAAFASSLYETLKSLKYPARRNGEPTDKELLFNSILENAKTTRDMAAELSAKKRGVSMSETSFYSTYLNNVIDCCKEYEKAMGNPVTEADKKRVRGIKAIRAAAVKNKSSLDKTTDRIEKEIKGKVLDETFGTYFKFSATSSQAKHSFFGDKYYDVSSRMENGNGYSMPRTGGMSIAVFALLNEGMSFKDLTDPAKKIAEKQAMYEKVTQMVIQNDAESQKWIAETIYNGHKNCMKMIDEQSKKLDFGKRRELIKDETYCRLMTLSFYDFDCWQEMAHCKDEITAVAAKDDPAIKEYADLREKWAFSPIAVQRDNYGKFIGNIVKVHDEKDPQSLKNAMVGALSNMAAVDNCFDYLEKGAKEQKRKPLHERTTGAEIQSMQAYASHASEALKQELPEGIFKNSYVAKGFSNLALKTHRSLTDNSRGGVGFWSDNAGTKEFKVTVKSYMNSFECRMIAATQNEDTVLTGLCKMGDEAEKAVRRSSTEYKEALKALKKYKKEYIAMLRKTNIEGYPDPLCPLMDLKDDVKEKINKYLERKERNKGVWEEYDEKTNNRILLMKTALKELESDKYQPVEIRNRHNMLWGMPVDEKFGDPYDPSYKENNVGVTYGNFIQKINNEKKSKDSESRKMMAKASLQAMSKISNILEKSNKALTKPELAEVKKAMAVILTHQKIIELTPNALPATAYDFTIPTRYTHDSSKAFAKLTSNLNRKQAEDFLRDPLSVSEKFLAEESVEMKKRAAGRQVQLAPNKAPAAGM